MASAACWVDSEGGRVGEREREKKDWRESKQLHVPIRACEHGLRK